VERGRAPSDDFWSQQIMARLKPGVTAEQALADLARLFPDTVRESWARRAPDTPNQGRAAVPQLQVMPGGQGSDGPRRDAAPMLSALFAIVGVVLLIGCVNLANLLLARASARRQEVGVRLALGASRARVIRQLLTESVLLATAGGVAATALAFWAKDFLRWVPTPDPMIVDPQIDLRILAFTAGLSLATGLAFGIWPAMRATRADAGPFVGANTRGGGAARGGVSKALTVAQIAICLVLIVGAGLFLRTLRNFGTVDVGFDPDNLLVFRIDPGPAGGDDARVRRLYESLLAEIEAIPGVQSATLSAMPVLAHWQWSEDVVVEGSVAPRDAFVQSVQWKFLGTMGIALRAGRDLSAADSEGRPRVAVVNEAMAKQIFDDPNPIGRRFHLARGPQRNVPIEVVGIVRDAKYSSLEEAAPPTFYAPYTQMPQTVMTCEVRTATDPLALVPAVRQAVRRVDASLPPVTVKTQRQQIAESIDRPRGVAFMTSLFGAVALLLACLGLYGVVSFDVTRRTGEIGIRMALGAQRLDVVALILRDAMTVVAIGAGIGVGLSLAAGRLVASQLFGIRPSDPATMVGPKIL